MDPSTQLPAGTQITALVSFDTTGNMGEMSLDAAELASYVNGQVPLSNGQVSLSTPLFNWHESMTVTGILQTDSSVGEVTGQIQQAIGLYNDQHVWALNDVQISIGTGTLTPGTGPASTGGPLQQLSGLFNSASQLGTVILIGVGVYFLVQLKRAV